jgi:aldose 1-epimerase
MCTCADALLISYHQLYSCNGIFNATNPIPRKASQGGPSKHYPDYSCVVIEQEGWIDAINNPQWHQNQILSPGEEYKWSSDYIFSVHS